MDILSPLKIEKVVYGGQGLARHEGKVVFVPFTIEGEKVTAKVTQSKKNFAQAEILRLIDSNAHRIEPKCIHFGTCGGCQFQHMDYKKQILTKQGILKENIGSYLNQDSIEIVGLEQDIWGYREHIKLTYQSKRLGYHGLFDKDVFQVDMCPIFKDNLKNDLEALKQAIQKADIDFAEIRLLKGKQSLIAAIKCADAHEQIFKDLIPQFQGVSIKKVSERKDYGDCYLTQHYLGKDFQMDVWSFMQSHRKMAELLYQFVVDQIPASTKVLLDLYCGSGILSILSATKNIPSIYGIELNPSAIECAIMNQKNHGISQIKFMASPAEHVLTHVKEKVDFVIVNPPREGLSTLMLDELFKMKAATFCYVSCNPTTLQRDLKRFIAEGYFVEKAKGFDLFPQTTHLETVCVIKKR